MIADRTYAITCHSVGVFATTFAPLTVGLMGREMGPELQRGVQGVVGRMFEVKLGVDIGAIPLMGARGLVTPGSESRSSYFGGGASSRRGSKASSRFG